MYGDVIHRSGGESRNCSLHVASATTVNLAIFNRCGEGRMLPQLLITSRHNISVAGKAEMWRSGAKACEKIVNVRCVFVFEHQAVTFKASSQEQLLQIVQSAAFMWRYGWAADQARNGWRPAFHSGSHIPPVPRCHQSLAQDQSEPTSQICRGHANA